MGTLDGTEKSLCGDCFADEVLAVDETTPVNAENIPDCKLICFLCETCLIGRKITWVWRIRVGQFERYGLCISCRRTLLRDRFPTYILKKKNIIYRFDFGGIFNILL